MTASLASDHTRHPVRSTRYQVPAELALGLVTLSVVVGFNRVFLDATFLGPLLVVAVYSHVVMDLARRRGWAIALAGLIGLAGLVLLLAYLFFAASTRYGLPSGATIDQFRQALNQSWNTFQNVTAPAPSETGFLLASSLALFFAVFLADWAAFRLWSTWEAIVPATTLFVFCSLLGSTVNRVPATAVFLSAALAFLLLHGVAKKETSAGWLSSDIARGSASLTRVGATIAAVTALAGIVVGPSLPNSDSEPLLCLNKCAEGKGANDRFTISPLVEIQNRLVEQADVELFQVESQNPAYWRMTSLDTFDGNSWRSKGKFTVAEGDLDAPAPPADSSLVEQNYKILGLARLWIPAAYQPVFVSNEANARYQPDSGTLIVDTELDTSDGLAYTVRSRIPSFTPDQLRSADSTIPPDIRQRYLALPSDFSSKARDEANTHTADQQTTYDKLRSLQDWFQGGEFKYNLKVSAGHGERAIDDFLARKEGYCEQFAGTFAAMARSLDIPARVAVGFTWGDQDANNADLYHVRGEHAHAWPEVYLGQYGWVAFDPTPGRGAPNMQRWTEVAPNQASADPNASSTTSTAPGSTTRRTSPVATEPQLPIDPSQLDAGTSSGSETDQASAVLKWVTIPPLVLVLGFLVYWVTVTSLVRSRWRRRRQGAQNPSAAVEVAWQESIEELTQIGVIRRAAETNDEFAHRVGTTHPELKGVVAELARRTDAATFGMEPLDEAAATAADQEASAITKAVRDRTKASQRFFNNLDPRPLLRASRHRPRHTATSAS